MGCRAVGGPPGAVWPPWPPPPPTTATFPPLAAQQLSSKPHTHTPLFFLAPFRHSRVSVCGLQPFGHTHVPERHAYPLHQVNQCLKAVGENDWSEGPMSDSAQPTPSGRGGRGKAVDNQPTIRIPESSLSLPVNGSSPGLLKGNPPTRRLSDL